MNLQASLQQAATSAEEKSEEIAEVFLSGQMDVESFLSSYSASRTVVFSFTFAFKTRIVN